MQIGNNSGTGQLSLIYPSDAINYLRATQSVTFDEIFVQERLHMISMAPYWLLIKSEILNLIPQEMLINNAFSEISSYNIEAMFNLLYNYIFSQIYSVPRLLGLNMQQFSKARLFRYQLPNSSATAFIQDKIPPIVKFHSLLRIPNGWDQATGVYTVSTSINEKFTRYRKYITNSTTDLTASQATTVGGKIETKANLFQTFRGNLARSADLMKQIEMLYRASFNGGAKQATIFMKTAAFDARINPEDEQYVSCSMQWLNFWINVLSNQVTNFHSLLYAGLEPIFDINGADCITWEYEEQNAVWHAPLQVAWIREEDMERMNLQLVASSQIFQSIQRYFENGELFFFGVFNQEEMDDFFTANTSAPMYTSKLDLNKWQEISRQGAGNVAVLQAQPDTIEIINNLQKLYTEPTCKRIIFVFRNQVANVTYRGQVLPLWDIAAGVGAPPWQNLVFQLNQRIPFETYTDYNVDRFSRMFPDGQAQRDMLNLAMKLMAEPIIPSFIDSETSFPNQLRSDYMSRSHIQWSQSLQPGGETETIEDNLSLGYYYPDLLLNTATGQEINTTVPKSIFNIPSLDIVLQNYRRWDFIKILYNQKPLPYVGESDQLQNMVQQHMINCQIYGMLLNCFLQQQGLDYGSLSWQQSNQVVTDVRYFNDLRRQWFRPQDELTEKQTTMYGFISSQSAIALNNQYEPCRDWDDRFRTGGEWRNRYIQIGNYAVSPIVSAFISTSQRLDSFLNFSVGKNAIQNYSNDYIVADVNNNLAVRIPEEFYSPLTPQEERFRDSMVLFSLPQFFEESNFFRVKNQTYLLQEGLRNEGFDTYKLIVAMHVTLDNNRKFKGFQSGASGWDGNNIPVNNTMCMFPAMWKMNANYSAVLNDIIFNQFDTGRNRTYLVQLAGTVDSKIWDQPKITWSPFALHISQQGNYKTNNIVNKPYIKKIKTLDIANKVNQQTFKGILYNEKAEDDAQRNIMREQDRQLEDILNRQHVFASRLGIDEFAMAEQRKKDQAQTQPSIVEQEESQSYLGRLKKLYEQATQVRPSGVDQLASYYTYPNIQTEQNRREIGEKRDEQARAFVIEAQNKLGKSIPLKGSTNQLIQEATRVPVQLDQVEDDSRKIQVEITPEDDREKKEL